MIIPGLSPGHRFCIAGPISLVPEMVFTEMVSVLSSKHPSRLFPAKALTVKVSPSFIVAVVVYDESVTV